LAILAIMESIAMTGLAIPGLKCGAVRKSVDPR
jgi:hypothetical protein